MPCLRHLRASGAWELGAPTPAAEGRPAVDLELLPFRSHVLYGDVPRCPTNGDFHVAASVVFHEEHEPAAHWRLEAVRWRGANVGAPLDGVALAVIGGRTAARLWKLAERRAAAA